MRQAKRDRRQAKASKFAYEQASNGQDLVFYLVDSCLFFTLAGFAIFARE